MIVRKQTSDIYKYGFIFAFIWTCALSSECGRFASVCVELNATAINHIYAQIFFWDRRHSRPTDLERERRDFSAEFRKKW